MERRKLNWGITWCALALMLLVVVLMLSGTLDRPTRVVLPETGGLSDSQHNGEHPEDSALTVVEVTPQTVQTVIATLARPEAYCRNIDIQYLWSGGSGDYKVTVAVSGDWSRIDRLSPQNSTRHTVTGPETTYVWYGNEQSVFTTNTGEISPDNEQAIPTYEDILTLPVASIAVADYRTISDVNSIYVETVPDENGYLLRYWVSVDTGLLVAAEFLQGEEPVYRMTSVHLDTTRPTVQHFTLPDGTILHEPES